MTRYAAFLRAINVGGHVVKMEQLRRLFEEWRFTGVETFIASGNVIFETDRTERAEVEKFIAEGLKEALGYPTAVFLRTGKEVIEIAGQQPFSAQAIEAAAALNVAFTGEELDASAVRAVMLLETEIDLFSVRGREVYWLCQKRQSDSKISNKVLEKTLGRPSTLRGIDTIRKMAAKYFIGFEEHV